MLVRYINMTTAQQFTNILNNELRNEFFVLGAIYKNFLAYKFP